MRRRKPKAKHAAAITDGAPRTVPFVTATADAVLLARIGAGHTPLFKTFNYRLDTTVDPTYLNCGKKNTGFGIVPKLWK